MTDRNSDRKYGWYICGKCGHEIYRLISEPDVVPCDECGEIHLAASSNASTGGAVSKTKDWIHRDRKQHYIPSTIKIDLAKPTQKPSGY